MPEEAPCGREERGGGKKEGGWSMVSVVSMVSMVRMREATSNERRAIYLYLCY
jgi:hypothetical protein